MTLVILLVLFAFNNKYGAYAVATNFFQKGTRRLSSYELQHIKIFRYGWIRKRGKQELTKVVELKENIFELTILYHYRRWILCLSKEQREYDGVFLYTLHSFEIQYTYHKIFFQGFLLRKYGDRQLIYVVTTYRRVRTYYGIRRIRRTISARSFPSEIEMKCQIQMHGEREKMERGERERGSGVSVQTASQLASWNNTSLSRIQLSGAAGISTPRSSICIKFYKIQPEKASYSVPIDSL